MKASITIESKLYFAKATSHCLQWKTGWMTRAQAEAAANKFCLDWFANGLPDATAAVFYRDGQRISDHCFEPDAIRSGSLEHDERGDN